MVLKRSTPFLKIFLLQAVFILVGCGNGSEESTGVPKPKKIESESAVSASNFSENESREVQDTEDVDWGLEVNLREMVEMARQGQIVEIQWHVLPNILRAQTSDGNIFHLRNENKGVDLRNTLIEEGIKIGRGGIEFRHVF